MNKIIATIRPVTLESQIADQDFLNQILAEFIIFSQDSNSSLILSKISIFASIAIQIESIKPAIEARVRVIQRTFTIAKIITTYKINAIEARKPDNLYIEIKNININKNQANQANINLFNELFHNFESIDFSEVRYIGAGTTQVLISVDNSFASGIV
jgi:hypothetical protein